MAPFGSPIPVTTGACPFLRLMEDRCQTDFCTVQSGVPDGIKCDVDGRVWSSAGDGVEIFAPDGHLIGKILLTRVANLCFGGPQYKTLYTVGQPYVSSIAVRVPGANSICRL